MESKNFNAAMDLLAEMQKDADNRIPAITVGEIIDRFMGIDQVKDVVPISNDGEYQIIIDVEDGTNELITFSFRVYTNDEGNVKLMAAKTCMDELFNYREVDEVRILERNEVSGRPEGVISYLITKIERYLPDKILTLDF